MSEEERNDDEYYDEYGHEICHEMVDDGWDSCGMMPDGLCMLAGSEWCDWDCPRNRS